MNLKVINELGGHQSAIRPLDFAEILGCYMVIRKQEDGGFSQLYQAINGYSDLS